MLSLILPLALVAQAAADKPLPPGQPFGPETVITFASNGALRNWQRGPDRGGYLFVRNRNERWYRVELTGPCQLQRSLDTLSYTTDVNGTFDRFSRLRVASLPNQACGVKSIRESTAPPGWPETRPKR